MKNIFVKWIQKNESLKKSEKISYFSLSLLALGIISAIIYVVAIISEPFADFFNRYISSFVRAIFAHLTSWLPFSLAEIIIITLPITLGLAVFYAVKYKSESWKSVISYCVSAVAAVSLLFTSFVWSFGVGYHTSTLDKKLGLERTEVSVEDLEKTANLLLERVNQEVAAIDYADKSFSEMPYSLEVLNEKLNACYDKFQSEHPFIQSLNSKVKPVMLSRPMSYTHITGVYTYFTGEANINVHFPDYTIPYTAAHELAHQRGIAREDEANFIAFLVCMSSDDPYIRYSGYLNTLEYFMSALYSADRDAYKSLTSRLDISVKHELNAYVDFYDEFKDSAAGAISSTVNDAYLKLQGTEGTKSYGMVVDLAVAFFKNDAYIQ